jgi:hypothetical protein
LLLTRTQASVGRPIGFAVAALHGHNQEWVTGSRRAAATLVGGQEKPSPRAHALSAPIFGRSEPNRTVGVTKPWLILGCRKKNAIAGQRRSNNWNRSPQLRAVFGALQRAATPNSIASFRGRFRSQPLAGTLCRRKGSGAALRPGRDPAVCKRKLREPFRLAQSLTRALK